MNVGHVGGAVAMWYFHKDDQSYDYPKMASFAALKWCFTSSSGTMAMGGVPRPATVAPPTPCVPDHPYINTELLMC